MKHNVVLDKIYEDEELSFLTRLEIAFHIMGCKTCAREVLRYEDLRLMMRSAFFGNAFADRRAGAAFADELMLRIEAEAESDARALELPPEEVSIRDSVIAGVVVVAALVTVFFGMDAGYLSRTFGSDFTIPLALVIGLVVTAYIAMFIVQNLKTLTDKFGLST
jgi:phosphotransferase system  glucose/maltose/N-acetylglucosamine-specific IIC component